MGAVEHLKTLCCLGLPPENAMIALSPLLHEVIPHGATRMVLLEPDASVGSRYYENPETATIFRERLWQFVNDPSSPMGLWKPGVKAIGAGWTLHLQGRGWLDSGWYRDIEAPLDSCWMMGAMIGHQGRAIAYVNLTRPRSARSFLSRDLQRLERLRPWIAHALRPSPAGSAALDGHSLAGFAGVPALSGQMIFTPGGKCLYQTSAAELLLTILAGERLDYQRPTPRREALPAPVLKVLTCILGAAGGAPAAPPRMEIRTAYGLVLAEAQWLLPAAFPPADAARDPKTCLIRLTIELREHALAHAARVLRELGASPAQIKVGAWLAMGKTKPEIARALGIKLGTAADLARKLYRILGVHNAAELGRKVWLTAGQSYPQHVKRGQAGGSS